MCKATDGVQTGNRVTKSCKQMPKNKVESYIFKDCRDFFDKKIENFFKKFKLKLLLSGGFDGQKISVSKCQDILLLLLQEDFIKNLVDEDSFMEVLYLEKNEKIFENSMKQIFDDVFFVSKCQTGEGEFLFKIFSVNSNKANVLKYWETFS